MRVLWCKMTNVTSEPLLQIKRGYINYPMAANLDALDKPNVALHDLSRLAIHAILCFDVSWRGFQQRATIYYRPINTRQSFKLLIKLQRYLPTLHNDHYNLTMQL